MIDALNTLARLSVPVFVVSSMLAMGLGLTLSAVIAPLKSRRLVAMTLLVNFVFAPGFAYLLTTVVPLERAYAVGLLLFSIAAGAPFLPKLVEAADDDLPLSIAVMALLTAGTILFMPLAVPVLIPGFKADAWEIAKPLLVMMVLPLVVAMTVRHYAPAIARRSRPALSILSSASLLLLLMLLIGLNFKALVGVVGSGAIAVSAVFIAVTFAAAYALGGAAPEQRGVLALAAVARNVAAALPAAATQQDPKIVVMLLVATLTGLVLSLLAAGSLKRHKQPQSETLAASRTAADPSPGEMVVPTEPTPATESRRSVDRPSRTTA